MGNFRSLRVMDFDTSHPAARRIHLEDITTEIQFLELSNPAGRVGQHDPGMVDSRSAFDHAHTRPEIDEPEGRARDRHPGLDLRAYWDPLDGLAHQIRDQGIVPMVAIETNPIPQQAGGDTKSNLSPAIRWSVSLLP